jgi:hypothetical protein
MRGQCGQIAAQFIEQRVESRKSSGISPHGDSDQLVCIGRAIVYFRVAGVLHAFMNARYQDPVRGQFITEDPAIVGIGPSTALTGNPNTATIDAFLNSDGQTSSAYLNDPQALNFYSYGRDNPLRYTDPTGKDYIDYNAAFTVPVYDVPVGLTAGVFVTPTGNLPLCGCRHFDQARVDMVGECISRRCVARVRRRHEWCCAGRQYFGGARWPVWVRTKPKW